LNRTQILHPSAPAAELSTSRNPGIDLLRGISIVLVVMHHVGLRIPLKNGALASFLPTWFLNALIFNGSEAVFIFFVISGFLITSNSLSRWGRLESIDARAFYVRRAARILPNLFVLVGLLSALHLAGARDYVIQSPRQSLGRAIISALTFHLNWYEGRTGYLPGNWDVLWSLSIEETFYLAFPLLCLGLRREIILAVAMAALALSLPTSRAALAGNAIWQEKAYLPGMAAIAAGVLGALIAARARPRRRWPVAVLMALGTLGIAGVLFFEARLWRFLGNGTLLVLTGATSALLVALHWRAAAGDSRPLPGTRFLRSCGRLSYEVYLTHMFVVWPLVRSFKTSTLGLKWGFLWYGPALLLSWVLGWVVSKTLSLQGERAVRSWLARSPARPSSCSEM
jgi:peptidoglycan/LPS O-acetylase OafA/YrhL